MDIRITTRLYIDASAWEKGHRDIESLKRFRIREKATFDKLDKIERTLNLLLENGTINNDIASERINEIVYAEEIAEETEKERIRAEEEKAARMMDLNAYIQKYIDEMRNGTRKNNKGMLYSPGTIKNKVSFQSEFNKFQEYTGHRYNYDDITMDFYNDFIAVSGIDGVSKDAVKSAAKQNQTTLQKIMSALAEIFAPLIPAIITGGLILGFRNCIDSIYFFENGTKTLCNISQFWSGVDSFLWLIGEAIFHMLPVCICWSVTKKMGTTQSLGIVLGLTLVSGQLLNAYAVASTAAADIPKWDFGFFTINMIGYQAQVIPAMLAAFTLVYLERLFRKICPPVVSMIVVPFCSLVPAVIIAHTVLGPIGWKIGSVISDVVYAGISGSFRVVFGAIFGFVYAPLVITGLHHMSNAIDMQLIADFGGTMLWPMIALSNIAQGSAVLGMIYLQRKNAAAQEVNVPSCISCYLGVTEPAMFGVNLKYHFPFVCGMIGSAAAAVVCVATSTTANAIGVGGIPGILSIQPTYMLSFALCMLIAIVVPFVLTVAIGKKKGVA